MVGKKIAELCLQKNIGKVCFDRGGNIYHGRVQVRQAVLPRMCTKFSNVDHATYCFWAKIRDLVRCSRRLTGCTRIEMFCATSFVKLTYKTFG